VSKMRSILLVIFLPFGLFLSVVLHGYYGAVICSFIGVICGWRSGIAATVIGGIVGAVIGGLLQIWMQRRKVSADDKNNDDSEA